MEKNSQYPRHLARLVVARLKTERGQSPPEAVLTRLLETVYFASLKTDEGRQVVCTVNFVDRNQPDVWPATRPPASRWVHVPFDRPLPLDVRNLTKLARATDPSVSSLTVYSDRKGKLFIWGLVDQEPRDTDRITLDADAEPPRPGLFQVSINGIGNVSVYVRYTLVGSLSQGTLVEAYHDVLWAGPIHDALSGYVQAYVEEHPDLFLPQGELPDRQHAQRELLMRYCDQHPGTIGFAVSQDGDIQAMTKVAQRLILWENIDVQLAFRGEAWRAGEGQGPPLLRRLQARPID